MGTHRCVRCVADVIGEFEQPRLRRWAQIYFLMPIPFVPVLPIIASDYFMMIPLTMLYMIGVGPALRIVTEQPTCPACGVFVEPRT